MKSIYDAMFVFQSVLLAFRILQNQMDFEPNVILIGCISYAHCTMNEFEWNETCTIAILWLYHKEIRSSSIVWNFFLYVYVHVWFFYLDIVHQCLYIYRKIVH